jgi:hypothetical protein
LKRGTTKKAEIPYSRKVIGIASHDFKAGDVIEIDVVGYAHYYTDGTQSFYGIKSGYGGGPYDWYVDNNISNARFPFPAPKNLTIPKFGR